MRDKLLELRKQGLTTKDIATIIGRKPKQVEYLLTKYGLTIHKAHRINAGDEFGCWRVKHQAISKKVGRCKSLFKRWIVECTNCGFQRETYTNFINEAQKHGCHKCGLRVKGESGLNALYNKYKLCADERGFQFCLTLEEFKNITSQDCFYCKRKPLDICSSNGERVRSRKGIKNCAWSDYQYNGIDRIDSAIGYKISNCVPCCKRCNWMKREMTISDWLEHMKKVILNECEIKNKLNGQTS